MTFTADAGDAQFGPWNPGIQSQIPAHLRHYCTIFRPENVFTSLADAEEMRDLTGLEFTELVTFQPRRLALHEVLIRVTADLSVPDGSRIEDLGINFRQMTGVLLNRCIEPRMSEIDAIYDAAKRRLSEIVTNELVGLDAAAADSTSALPTAKREFLRFFKRAHAPAVVTGSDARDPLQLIATWGAKAHSLPAGAEQAAYRALSTVVSALLIRHGSVWGSRQLIASLVTDMACNHFGSDEIGRLIEPWMIHAAKIEGYSLLPRQEQPVVMNTKGPSASGKSTLRPLQKTLAGDIGVTWSEFALISPDIWRKQLVDYDSLGPVFRYAASFTGEELQIIDQKLDRYMARKAGRGDMSHLLIDRFRFDSFAPDSNEAGSNLLTRFGQIVYLFFVITPPASLVERAWNRGLEFGRYKAVDDTLAHSVVAYSGMPQLFFTWIQRTDKRVYFEFLDNSVRLGERPRTIAFGWNDTLNVLDVKCALDVERYRRVDVNATAPELLYSDQSVLAPENNTGFLKQCIDKFREINIADQDSGRIYLRIVSGKPVWADREALERAASNPDTRAGVLAMAPAAFDRALAAPDRPMHLSEIAGAKQARTLGRWGTSG
ncbi:MAG: hypothetical protein AUG50_00760 [Betaproteobacteria bacterium 13_1_20CM_3_63_8]|nr:MAG: hypothetical protein AUG50_00760 [Betaproteobacteria bacterium 13_1_20CM_3_63_8]